MSAGASAPQRRTREQILALLDAEDSDGALLDLVFESAERRDPELPDLLRACSIPRKITAQVIGVLRGRPDEDDRNAELLDLVCAQSFVTSRQGGGYAYHDSTREYLLADWRSSDEKRTRFIELNEKLISFYRAEYAASLRSDRLLGEVRALIASVNPGRLKRLTSTIDTALGNGLQDTAYHLLLARPQDVEDFISDAFFQLEPLLKVGVVQGLIWFVRDYIQRDKPVGTISLARWLDYFEARIARAFPGYDLAFQMTALNRLIGDDETPAKLRSWALAALAEVYQDQLDLTAALRTKMRSIESVDDDPDPYNTPALYLQLATLHSMVGNPGQAIRAYRDAITISETRQGARPDIAVHSSLYLADSYGELCDWDRAFATVTKALYTARTSFASDVEMAQAVAQSFARLLGRFDLRASDCAAAESLELAGLTPESVPGALLEKIKTLLTADRVQTALTWIDSAEAVRSPRIPLFPFELAYRRGQAAEIARQGDEADRIFSEVLAELPDGPEAAVLRLNTRILRGKSRTDLGDLDGAIADLEIVLEELDRCGFNPGATGATGQLVIAHARAGHHDEAAAILSAAEASVPSIPSPERSYLLDALGELAESSADWDAAQEHYEQALNYVVARRELGRQAVLARKLAGLNDKRSRPDLAARWTQQAEEATAAAEAADRIIPTDDQLSADKETRRGIRAFVRAEDRTGALEEARDHFTKAAERDPDNLWPALNLAFIYAEQEDWQGASEQVARALRLGPAPLRTSPQLTSCLGDHALRHVRSIMERADPWSEKAAAVAQVVERVADLLPGPLLAPLLAMQAVALLLSGEDDMSARAVCREALATAPDAFAAATGPFISTVNEFWAVDDLLRAVQEDQEPADPSGTAAVAVARERAGLERAALHDRLAALLGLDPGSSVADSIPVPKPIILEVGADLVPDVDSRADGGVFLFQLMPAMRQRIAATTGVTVPGVHARDAWNLPGNGYRIMIDETTVLTGTVPVGATIEPLARGAAPTGDVMAYHPLTGEPGWWVITEPPADPPETPADPPETPADPPETPADSSESPTDSPDGAERLTTAQYLANRVELVVRAHLIRFLGPQEADTLAAAWAAEQADSDGNLVESVLPDAEARLALTWVLQRLVTDGVSVADWRSLLPAIRDSGGVTTPPAILYRAVRERLGRLLPGPWTGRTGLTIQDDLEAALIGTEPERTERLRSAAQLTLAVSLRQAVMTNGPALVVITKTHESRELIAAYARVESPLVTALTAEEAGR